MCRMSTICKEHKIIDMENIDSLKHSIALSPVYRLSNADVYVSNSGYHYIDYLDPAEDFSPHIDEPEITDEEIVYIEKSLQSNPERFENQIDILESHESISGKNILDIGCGGGLFLSLAKDQGAKVIGIELSKTRAHYAKNKYGLEVVNRPIEDPYWKTFHGKFDFVTLWDVIEHVNFPLSTLLSASRMLKSGGFLFIDTPCRDSFYHRMGEITYRLSKGKYPTFLNAMYSAHRFGHKQIFSTSEMKHLLEEVDLKDINVSKFHELSFPYSFYLKKMFRSDVMVSLMLPVVYAFLSIFPVKNKMLAVGCKK